VSKKEQKNADASSPERPIQTEAEDRLDRGGFVRRLTNALINKETGVATGVVVGLTGPWGSGKSSILNLLENHVKKTHSSALIVRFNPWLVSGRDDLISQFFSEIIGTINSQSTGKAKARRVAEKSRGFAKAISEYGAQLAPSLNLVVPGAGSAAQGALRAAQKALQRETSLHSRRTQVLHELKKLAVPIVIMIDELDRVEDSEIRTIVQLVRSVLDFPGISYALAYDAARVAQALGGGVDNDSAISRGRAYLEKIVQIQIPLPIAFAEEISGLFLAELASIEGDLKLPSDWQRDERFQELSALLYENVINTPRDIKRLIGVLHVIGGMVAGEVDWIDVVGFGALMVKYPGLIEKIRENPEALVENPISLRGQIRSLVYSRNSGEDRLKEFGFNTAGSEVEPLLAKLFPCFSRDGSDKNSNPNAICRRRPLLTMLRFGLPPGTYSRSEVVSTLRSSSPKVAEAFEGAFVKGSLSELMARIYEIYPDEVNANHLSFWSAAYEFCRKKDNNWLSSFSSMHNVGREFADIFVSVAKKNSKFPADEMLHKLIKMGDLEIFPNILRSHIHHYGLYKSKKSPNLGMFLSLEETHDVASKASKIWRGLHVAGKLLPAMWQLDAVYTACDLGDWDNECKQSLVKVLSDERALDAFMMFLFGPGFTTGQDTIDEIVGAAALSVMIEARQAEASFRNVDESVRLAYDKAGFK
jgi:energy-coupling factor transporter ATP-binding protein EcfA2